MQKLKLFYKMSIRKFLNPGVLILLGLLVILFAMILNVFNIKKIESKLEQENIHDDRRRIEDD